MGHRVMAVVSLIAMLSLLSGRYGVATPALVHATSNAWAAMAGAVSHFIASRPASMIDISITLRSRRTTAILCANIHFTYFHCDAFCY